MATSEVTRSAERRPSRLHKGFDAFSSGVARRAGHPAAFVLSALGVAIWGVTGPVFGFSDTWQLVINTATTVLTFLMVFVIQNTINRDSMALHLKLDELVRVTTEARDALIGAERLSEDEIQDLERDEMRRAENAES
jgi:low affinity Fe/Cu permease